MTSQAAITLTPCVDDGRRAVTLAWDSETVIGRQPWHSGWVTSNTSGMPEDPRVSRKHIRVHADKSTCAVKMTVLSKVGTLWRRPGAKPIRSKFS